MQVATDWTHHAFLPIGLSGMLEVMGRAWWGLGLVVAMRRGRVAALVAARPAGLGPVRIEANLWVADVLKWFPRTEDVSFVMVHGPETRSPAGRWPGTSRWHRPPRCVAST